ncbi:KEOPS complex subunit Pcc1 [Halospeciosus flavus]|uniref:KEOPS complex subunit Pcc1 n=1 Tax=Halospeciosus flavus TaxID=3032283 RepID=A0ABD5Z5X8_9EURY|nr:KEOPS complex subunit Pcc1 [Halospeciosus flavus]
MTTHRTTLLFDYDDVARARLVERSVAREAGEIDSERTSASVGRDGRTVEVVVEASDLTALRAGSNSWCGLVSVAERTAALGDTGNTS